MSRYAETDSQRYLWHIQQLRRKKRARRREPDIVFAQVLSTTGDPIIHEDVDGDGLWDAYEFQASGSIELTEGKIGRRLWQGGGGSGGHSSANNAAGGGGGGWTEQDNTEANVSGGVYTIVVGAGGIGTERVNSLGTSGSPTVAFDIAAPGGGGAEQSGGNGGGGGAGPSDRFAEGGIGDPGFNGGDGFASETSSERGSGGGAGSGGPGESGTIGSGGAGGPGIDSDILGAIENFGAGGGASIDGAAGGTSSEQGWSSDPPANPLPTGRGGGSGGGSSGTGPRGNDGGSGCFIIRIRRAA